MKPMIFALGALLVSSVAAAVAGFDITRMPTGKSVTLPNPAITLIPSGNQAVLTATDVPQTIKFSGVGAKGAAFKVALYDPQQPVVKYLDVRPGQRVVYTFKTLGAIRIIPNLVSGKGQSVRLRVESNRPLGISH